MMSGQAQDSRARAVLPEPPRRILMTADAIGGVWTFALELAQGLSAYGIEVFLAVMGHRLSAQQRRQAGEVGNITLFESTYRLEWMEDPWKEVERAGRWLLSLEDKVQPDLVHLNGYVHAALPWECPCLVVAHSCVLSWWEAVRKTPLPPSFHQYRERVARGLAAADMVTAPSAAMLASVERHYGAPRSSRVIHNGRSAELFRPEGKKEVILSVGRLWDDAKNVALLAQEAARLPWPVYVAGEERHPFGGHVALANVKRLGQLAPHQVAPWFGTAAIYALPARYEPFGLTVLEAALSGCALVLGDIPTLRELWEDAAVFVDPEDGSALRSALRGLCADPVQRTFMALKALYRSRSFTVPKMAAEYLAAYLALSPVWGDRDSDLRRAAAYDVTLSGRTPRSDDETGSQSASAAAAK